MESSRQNQYALYLRKSRRDAEMEALGAGETLARHRKTLLELAGRMKSCPANPSPPGRRCSGSWLTLRRGSSPASL